MRIAPFLIGAALGLTLASELRAQSDSLKEGTRVRVTAPSLGVYHEVGAVVSADSQWVVLNSAAVPDHRIPRGAVTALEVSEGTRPVTGFVLGAVGGFAAGLTIGAFVPPRAVGTFSLLGLIVGAVAGTTSGAHDEHWRPAGARTITVHPIVHVGATSSAGLSISF